MAHQPLDPHVPLSPVVRALRSAALGLALATTLAGAAHAQTADTAQARKAYHVPAGPLGPALLDFAGQAGVNLSMDMARTRGLVTEGLAGDHTVADGFARLLARSGLAVRALGDGAYTLVSAAAGTSAAPASLDAANPTNTAAALPAVTVTGRTQSSVMAPTRQVTTLEREELVCCPADT